MKASHLHLRQLPGPPKDDSRPLAIDECLLDQPAASRGTWMSINTYIDTFRVPYTYVYIYIYVNIMYIYILSISISMCISICIYVYYVIFMYIYIYIHMHSVYMLIDAKD